MSRATTPKSSRPSRSARPRKAKKKAVKQSRPFLETYRDVLRPEDIIEAGARLGVIRRQRKLDLPKFVEATIMSMIPTPGMQTTAYVSYLGLTGESIAPSSFYDRFTPEFAQLMKHVAQRGLQAVRDAGAEDLPTRDLGVLLQQFDDVRVADSTTHLLKKLAKAWAPSTSKPRPAGIKFHTVISLRDDLPVADRLTPQKMHDNRAFPEETMAPGTLSIFDLGYIDVERFVSAIERGAHFLTRLKASHNPEIDRVFVGKGSRRAVRGLRLDAALESGSLVPDLGVLDLDVRLTAKGKESTTARVVGVVDSESNELHWYITSIDRNTLDAHDVASAYRLRWTVELVFKQMKSGLGFDTILAWRQPAVTALVYAKIAALSLSRLLEAAVQAKDAKKDQLLSRLAMVLVLSRSTPLLMTYSLMSDGVTPAQLEDRILMIASIVARSRNRRRDRARIKREAGLGRHE